MITVLPAIDLKGGRCVRLRQGRAEDETVFAEDPVAMARAWEQQGAQWLHVVDLDGAFQGRPAHTAVISAICAATSLQVEVGGGLRTDDELHEMLKAGVRRVIIGTRAFVDTDGLQRLATRFGDALAVGIDARDGMVQVRGWVETTREPALELAVKAEAAGVKTIIYTDTATDGMMQGPNVSAMADMCDAVSCSVIASGGISSVQDLVALRQLNRDNLTGAIVGRALYEQTVLLPEMIAAGRDDEPC